MRQRNPAYILAAAALSFTLSGCAGIEYVEHRSSGDPAAALQMESLVGRIPLTCPSGESTATAEARGRMDIDTNRYNPERQDLSIRSVRRCQ